MKLRMRSIWFVLLISPLYVRSVFTQNNTLAIVGATVVSPERATPLPNATILIENGRIVSVGPVKSIRVPPSAQVIKAEGKWVIPGLIDSHIHFFQSGGLYTRPDVIDLRKHLPYEKELEQIRANLADTFARYIRSGITSVVDVGGPFWNFDVRELASKTSLAPRVAVAGPLVSTYQPAALTTDDPPIIKVNNPDEARALVRKQIERKTDLIKIWYIVRPGISAEANFELVKATIDEAHRHRVRAAVHATQLETAKLAVKAGADILVHSVFDTEVDAEFIHLLKKNGVIYIPTLVVYEGYDEVLSQQINLTTAEYEMANPHVVGTLFDLRKLPQEDLPERVRNLMNNPQPITRHLIAIANLKTLYEAGIIIAAGTDAGNIGTLHGPAIFREFELMAAAELSPQAILYAATLNGAKVMGREKQLGTIERGKLADVVILNANPLEDIRNTAKIHTVVKNGITFPALEIIKKNPVDVVQQQLNAYNAGDIEAFLATYSPSIKIYNHPSDSLLMSGQDAMRERYGRLFTENPNQHCEILSRMVLGRFVVDHEKITGRRNPRIVYAIAIYEVRNGLIENVWLVRD